jgi:hypothetical protein
VIKEKALKYSLSRHYGKIFKHTNEVISLIENELANKDNMKKEISFFLRLSKWKGFFNPAEPNDACLKAKLDSILSDWKNNKFSKAQAFWFKEFEKVLTQSKEKDLLIIGSLNLKGLPKTKRGMKKFVEKELT